MLFSGRHLIYMEIWWLDFVGIICASSLAWMQLHRASVTARFTQEMWSSVKDTSRSARYLRYVNVFHMSSVGGKEGAVVLHDQESNRSVTMAWEVQHTSVYFWGECACCIESLREQNPWCGQGLHPEKPVQKAEGRPRSRRLLGVHVFLSTTLAFLLGPFSGHFFKMLTLCSRCMMALMDQTRQQCAYN